MFDDSDGPEFSDDSERVARKSHQCYECRRTIDPGERYSVTVGKWDGEFSMYKRCSHCEVLREWLSAECSGWVYGAMIEDVREHLVEGSVREYGWPLARLVIAAQHDWRRNGRLMPVPTRPQSTHERLATAGH